MPTAARTFRVFVSSTFEDLKEERNALQREVFPKLAKLCEEHGARFQAIDLRWGVRDEAGLDQKTMEICLAEIERCKKTNLKPNFIVLLGDRYGWRPLSARIEAGEFERLGNAIGDDEKRALVDTWYQRDDNAVPPEFLLKSRTGEFTDAHRWGEVEGVLYQVLREAARYAGVDPDGLIKYEASATHQEILKGLGHRPEDREHVFALLRNATKDQDPDVGNLKETLKQQLGENVFSFDAGDYGVLCERVRESLERVILNEVARFESRRALDLEIDSQNTFAAERSKHFVGRAAVMSAINDYVRSDDRRPLVIHGASGSGKSAIMAKASGAEGAVRRFIGPTPESSNGLTLLRSLCQEIARCYGQPEDVPATFNELAVTFADRIKLATRERPLLLFLDALDQLGPQDPAAAAEWLPIQLPPHCKVVVSTIEVSAALQRAGLLAIEPFSADEADQALALWFEEVQRTLQKEQREKLLASFRRSPLPLYLKLAFEEARRWKSFDPIGQCVLGEGFAEIVDRFFRRLSEEASHGPVLVSRALGYLTAARYGLAEDEILAVLSNDDEVWKDFLSRAKHEPPERRLPVIVWSRIYLDLEPYLTERAAPGGAVISFYHRQLVELVLTSSFHHSALASYFAGQPLWLGPQRPNQRKVTELVRQQVKAERLDDVVGTLTDIEYLEAKCAAELVFDLQTDNREALAALPEAQVELREEDRRGTELAHWTQDLTEYAQKWSQWRDQRTRPGFLARFMGRIRREAGPTFPATIRCIEPWNNEQIAAECRRIIENPARLDRLRAFAGFVAQELYPLVEFGKRPGFVVQQAFNAAPAGPVHQAASQRMDSTPPVLLRYWSIDTVYNPKQALLCTLEGHTNGLSSVSVTADGLRAVSGSWDKTLRMWDLESGACLRTLEGHTDKVLSLSVTPNGRRAVSGSGDKTLRVWDLESGTCLHTLEGHTDAVSSVSVTPDGQRAVSASKDRRTRVWSLESGVCSRTLNKLVQNMDVTADGRRAAAGSGDKALRLWDLETGACLRTLMGHTDAVTSVSVTPDGRRAVSGSGDKTLRVWDLETGDCLHTLEGHTDAVSSVSVTPDGRLAVSGGEEDDRALRVWDLESGACLRTLRGHTYYVESVKVTPDGRRAVSGSGDGTLRLWDLESGASPSALPGHTGIVWALSVTLDGRRAVSGSRDGTLRVWDPESGTCLRILEGHKYDVDSVSVTADGRRAVSGSRDKTLRVWDLESGICLHVLEGHEYYVESVSVTADGRRALSASGFWPLRVWDLESGACLRTLEGHSYWVQSVSVTPDGRRAVSGDVGRSLRVWDLESGTCLHRLEGHTDGVSSVSVTPDGRRAVSGSEDKTLRVWNLETGTCLRTLDGHTDRVRRVVVTPDGRMVVSASRDKTLRVWHLESGSCLRTLEGHTGDVDCVFVTPDGRRAVSGSEDRTLRVWDLESGICLAIARLNAQCKVAVGHGNHRIVAGTSTGEVLFFDMRGI